VVLYLVPVSEVLEDTFRIDGTADAVNRSR
jgi:hypothetical protein